MTDDQIISVVHALVTRREYDSAISVAQTIQDEKRRLIHVRAVLILERNNLRDMRASKHFRDWGSK